MPALKTIANGPPSEVNFSIVSHQLLSQPVPSRVFTATKSVNNEAHLRIFIPICIMIDDLGK